MFLPSPPPSPCRGLAREGKLISNTQVPAAASSAEGAEHRGVREKNLKINPWASPSPADRLSGGLWVRFKFVVATAAGQGTEGESEGAVSQLWIRGLWWNGNQTSFNHTPGETSGNALFLEAVTRPSPIFPITSACGARNWPETNPKGPSSTRIARWPVSSGGPWPSHDASGADLGLARQDLRMPRLSPQKAGWQVPGTGAGALGGRVQQL